MISEIKDYEGLYLIDTEVLSMISEIKGYEGGGAGWSRSIEKSR